MKIKGLIVDREQQLKLSDGYYFAINDRGIVGLVEKQGNEFYYSANAQQEIQKRKMDHDECFIIIEVM